ncbi:MAG TPA: aminotransferase class I/II-fold pyridoxal phosphate-dependent enzyme, partial [Geobacterales bacterium]|nr:aminotransferase class I/II-fold pyridoxal phosphate-dependent enzyme [Geobacterales bacterium]
MKIESKLAKSVLEMEESGILKISQKVEELRNKGMKVWRLDIGDPGFNTPKIIIDKMYEYTLEGYTHYGPPPGVKSLRVNIAKIYNCSFENVIVTPGSKQGILYALRSILNPGEEVIVILPAWPEYLGPVELSGGKASFVHTRKGFMPDVDSIKRNINDKTKAIILNSPNNPTGVVYSESFLKEIADLALEHELFVISDEIYSELIYGNSYASISKFMDFDDGLIIVNGFSKTYAMTGWRLGYVVAHEEIVKQMIKIQGHTITSPPTFLQYAAITALNDCKPDVKKMVAELDERRKFIMQSLSDANIEFIEPKGAFYFFIDLS